MTLSQLARILWAHRWVELLILATTVGVALLATSLIPREYTATAALFVDIRSPDPVAGGVSPGMLSTGYMATQAEIIASDRVTRNVITNLQIEQNVYLRDKWRSERAAEVDFKRWLVTYLKKRLAVRPARESSVLSIAFTAHDPEFAAEVANGFAHAYLEVNLQLKLEPAKQYASWFEGQTKALRAKFESAQEALSTYQRRAGILGSDDRIDFETAKLNEISTQLTELQAQTSDSKNRRSARHADSLAEVMKSEVVTGLKLDIARLEAKLQETQSNLGPYHPQTARTVEELRTLKQQLTAEMRQISRSIETSFEIGKQRERDLQSALESQKVRVLELNTQRDEIAVLRRDVESAQRAFEAVSQRAAQTRLESLANQTNVVSLDPAEAPSKASHPNRRIYALAALFIGVILAATVGLLLEFLNRRVRSTQDLLEILDVPVLATLGTSALPVASGWHRGGLLGFKRSTS